MFCSKCGNELVDGKVCQICSQNEKSTASFSGTNGFVKNRRAVRSSKKKKAIAISIIGVVLTSLIILIVLLTSGGDAFKTKVTPESLKKSLIGKEFWAEPDAYGGLDDSSWYDSAGNRLYHYYYSASCESIVFAENDAVKEFEFRSSAEKSVRDLLVDQRGVSYGEISYMFKDWYEDEPYEFQWDIMSDMTLKLEYSRTTAYYEWADDKNDDDEDTWYYYDGDLRIGSTVYSDSCPFDVDSNHKHEVRDFIESSTDERWKGKE